MELQPTGFDYAQLDAETRYKVLKRTLKARKAQRNAIKGIIESGQQYSEIRDILAYDRKGFQGWCEKEGIERKYAYRCMDVYNLFLKCVKLDTLKLAISTVYELAAPGTPEQAVAEIVDRAEKGETISLSKAKWTIESYKPERKPRSRPESTDPDPETSIVYEDTPDPTPPDDSIEPGEKPASVSGGHLPANAPVGTVYRNGKAEASAPLFSDVGTNTPFTHPGSNGQPYTNGTGTPPIDSRKLQAEVDRLRAENERLTRQLEAMRKLNTPPLLIHMVNDAKVSPDAVSLVMKKHGEVKTRLLLQTCIEFKVTPHDILALSENWSQMVSKSSIDPLEEQRKADEKAAKKAAKRVYPANVNTWKLQHMMDYYAANGEALDALRHALGIDTDMIHWDDSSMNERREYVKLFQELERTHVSTDCYSKMIAYARSKWADIPVYKMADRISEWKQSLTPATASVIPGDDPRYHTITHPDIEGAEIPDYVAPQQVPA